MTKHTKRDKIWDAALRIGEKGAFTPEECLFVAGLDMSSERTCRDVLNTMTEMGHLNDLVYPYQSGKVRWIDPDIDSVVKGNEINQVVTFPSAFED